MKETVKYGLIIGGTGILIAIAVVLYLFNMPHRNVQREEATYNVDANQLVSEFLTEAEASNSKYLDKVIIISGQVLEITDDQLKQKVVSIKTTKAGINCTFTIETNANAVKLKVGEIAKIKGIVRLGASYDADLDLTEFAILEKCDIVK
jgi:hypothetical protein